MGKSKTKRFGSLKPNPIGLITEVISKNEPQINNDMNDQDSTPSALANIIEKLQSTSSEERACGCQLMASIVSQPKAIGYLLKENVVKMTAPLFLDKCLDVRKSALGALRNMSVYGQADVSEVMLEHDILTPLTALLQTYGNGWLPDKEASKYDTNIHVLIESLELLSNLCECNNLAVKRFNKDNLLCVILPLLNVEVYGYQLCNAVARCLLVVSENNVEVSQVCQKQEVVSNLLFLIESEPNGIDAVLLRTLSAGILLNLSQIDLSLHYKGIIKAVLQVLEMDTFTVIDAALQTGQLATEEDSLENEMAWPEVDKLLTAQGVSLELLANMCCSDDEWEDFEELSSDDQVMEVEAEPVESSLRSLCHPSEITSAFLEQNILTKILQKVSPLTEAQIKKLQGSDCGNNTLKKLLNLQTRALLCISNIVDAVDATLLSQSIPLTTVWTGLYQVLHSTNSDEDDFRWAVTSALRAVIQPLAEVQKGDVSIIQVSDIDFLVDLSQTTKNRETQINVIKILSTIGCNTAPSSLLQMTEFILARRQSLLSLWEILVHIVLCLNKAKLKGQSLALLTQYGSNTAIKIGAILLEVASQNKDLIVVSEALDSLFDVFKEDNTDGIAQEIHLVDQLVALQTSFQQRIKGKRKEFGENYSVVMMAKANLSGFIKYKMSCG